MSIGIWARGECMHGVQGHREDRRAGTAREFPGCRQNLARGVGEGTAESSWVLKYTCCHRYLLLGFPCHRPGAGPRVQAVCVVSGHASWIGAARHPDSPGTPGGLASAHSWCPSCYWSCPGCPLPSLDLPRGWTYGSPATQPSLVKPAVGTTGSPGERDVPGWGSERPGPVPQTASGKIGLWP